MITRIDVYSDGSNDSHLPKDKQESGCGIIVVKGGADGSILQTFAHGRYIGIGTNSIAEMNAVKFGLQLVIDEGKNLPVVLHTDSQYCVNVLTKLNKEGTEWHWQARAHVDLVESIRVLIRQFNQLTISWVKGHNKHSYNELAHEFACQAKMKRSDVHETLVDTLQHR